jgi:integrase
MGKKGVSYQVRYRRSDGGQASRTFRTRREAEVFNSKVVIDDDGIRSLTRSQRKITFAEVAERWVKQCNHRPRTATARDQILRVHLLPNLGLRPIRTITTSDLRDLVAMWRGKGYSSGSIRNFVRIISPIMKMALADDLITKNPTSALRLEPTRPATRIELSPKQCQLMLLHAGDYYRPLIYFLLVTGVRVGEALEIRVGNVDFEKSQVLITESKTTAGCRRISLCEHDLGVVRRQIEAMYGSEPKPAQHLFLGVGGQPVNDGFLRRQIIPRIIRESGLPKFTPHDLRRAHATMLVDAGVNPLVVKERMGHASIETTLSYYARPTARALESASEVAINYITRTDSPAAFRPVPKLFPILEVDEIP